jgi:hypothetical protein
MAQSTRKDGSQRDQTDESLRTERVTADAQTVSANGRALRRISSSTRTCSQVEAAAHRSAMTARRTAADSRLEAVFCVTPA